MNWECCEKMSMCCSGYGVGVVYIKKMHMSSCLIVITLTGVINVYMKRVDSISTSASPISFDFL